MYTAAFYPSLFYLFYQVGGSSGKMTPGEAPKEVEMGVRYQAHGKC